MAYAKSFVALPDRCIWREELMKNQLVTFHCRCVSDRSLVPYIAEAERLGFSVDVQRANFSATVVCLKD